MIQHKISLHYLLMLLFIVTLLMCWPQQSLANNNPCQSSGSANCSEADDAVCASITHKTHCDDNPCCIWIPPLPTPETFFQENKEYENDDEQEQNGPRLKIPELQITLPGLVFSDENKIQTVTDGDKTFFYIPWIGEYIKWLYNYSIGIIGLLALLAIMIGGFYWIMAGGSASRVSEAKSWISAAISGLALALASYLLLFTLNSNLVQLPSIKMMAIKTIPLEYDIPLEWQTEDASTSGPSSHGVPLYYQCSSYAKSIYYPTKNGNCADSTLCAAGCGVLSTFMAINKFTTTKNLKEFTQEAIKYGARETFNGKECNGSTASGLIALARSYGLQSNHIADGAEEIGQYLDRDNCVVVISVGAGGGHPNCKFTNGGHFIVLTGWRDKSQQIADVNDPMGDRSFPKRGNETKVDKTWISLKDWGQCRLSQKFYICK